MPDEKTYPFDLVLLDIDKSKENFEVGHAYFVDGKVTRKQK